MRRASPLTVGFKDLMEELHRIQQAIERLINRARTFFYEVVLSGHTCPDCDAGLIMLREGRCCCEGCGKAMDPTIQFQTCPACSGRLFLRLRRYACRRCGRDVPSRYLFDGKVFNAEYFRRKMAESRDRRRQRRRQDGERQRTRVSHAATVEPGRIDLQRSPGLIDLLNQLVGQAPDQAANSALARLAEEQFDLQRYQRHVLRVMQALASDDEIAFRSIPPVTGRDNRLERIRLFIAVIFLAHAGTIDVRQGTNNHIWVSKRETQREGHSLPQDSANAVGVA